MTTHNDDPIRDLERTTAGPASSARHHSEEDADRTSFLRLGELLDRASERFDEQAFRRQFDKNALPHPAKQRHASPWALPLSVVGGSLVAAVLFFLLKDSLLFTLPGVDSPDAIQVENVPAQPSNSLGLSLRLAPFSRGDLLDDQLAQAASEIRQIGFFPKRISQLELLESELHSFREGLFGSSL